MQAHTPPMHLGVPKPLRLSALLLWVRRFGAAPNPDVTAWVLDMAGGWQWWGHTAAAASARDACARAGWAARPCRC